MGLKRQIVKRLCADGNEVVGFPRLPTIKMPVVEPHEKSGALVVVGEREVEDYTMHPLVSGDAFRPEDIRLEEVHQMESTSSGVCHHVTRHKLEKLIARIQSDYRKRAFETAEVDLQSEEAFDLARKGIPRARLFGAQIIYECSVKRFHLPCFIHELGVNLGTTASCARLRRASIGPFHSSHALLEKQISLQNILRNIELCRRIMNSLGKDEGVIYENNSPYEEVRDVVDGLDLHIDHEYDAMRPVWPRNYT
uniref:TruB_N domain-containing protein n=1 Tax=Angiostrongylus cantonensis TaxID=6313 RepID=A0A0K0DGN5_ANGCA